MSVLQWSLMLGLAVLAGLDRTALAQLQLCRPLLCGPVAGLIVGNWQAGLLIGMLLEPVWLLRLPVGATVAPDDTQATLAAVSLHAGSLVSFPLADPVSQALLALLCASLAPLGRCPDILARHCNGRLAQRAQDCLAVGQVHAALRCHGWGAVLFALASLCSFTLLLLLGLLTAWLLGEMLVWLRLVPDGRLATVLLLCGLAALVPQLAVPRGAQLFFGAFAATSLLLALLG
ncbi:PTS sugar transporter subunit IIC [Desulfuromonas thiophila]|uniref:PTS system, mannose-specific IIC component n=1 Tax=Desulfuromonas thiophila TaxID=57664 RepID=A0A1G7ASX2_9BACT|nr:PTS sugar transporter subunit IIC [Desulfuromonas thiophila]SDE17095.1 PTS system, mannose-specific IIC component [Desulfuromonas thiophila]